MMEKIEQIYIKIMKKLVNELVKDTGIKGYEKDLYKYLSKNLKNVIDKDKINNFKTLNEVNDYYMDNILHNDKLYMVGSVFLKEKKDTLNNLNGNNHNELIENNFKKVIKLINNVPSDDNEKVKINKINKLIMKTIEKEKELKNNILSTKIDIERKFINIELIDGINNFIINKNIVINLASGWVYYIDKKININEINNLERANIPLNNRLIEKLILNIIGEIKNKNQVVNFKYTEKDKERVNRLKELVNNKKEVLLSKGLKFEFSSDNKSIKVSNENSSYIITPYYIKEAGSTEPIVTRESFVTILNYLLKLKNIQLNKFTREEWELTLKLLLIAWDLRRKLKYD